MRAPRRRRSATDPLKLISGQHVAPGWGSRRRRSATDPLKLELRDRSLTGRAGARRRRSATDPLKLGRWCMSSPSCHSPSPISDGPVEAQPAPRRPEGSPRSPSPISDGPVEALALRVGFNPVRVARRRRSATDPLKLWGLRRHLLRVQARRRRSATDPLKPDPDHEGDRRLAPARRRRSATDPLKQNAAPCAPRVGRASPSPISDGPVEARAARGFFTGGGILAVADQRRTR